MSTFRVIPESLGDSGSSLGGDEAQLADCLDLLRAASNALVGQWSGEAQQAFLRSYSAWEGEMRHLLHVLGEASAAASAIAETYRQADERVGSLWGI